MSPALLISHSALRIPLPLFVASAGACGAMLTITLLQPTELILEPGRVLVVHDPLGLTADRLLAHVYREVAHRNAAGAEPGSPVATSLRWLIARPPLARVWDAVEALGRRSWRLAPRRPPVGANNGPQPLQQGAAHPAAGLPAARVAEAPPRPSNDRRAFAPAVLILSEAERPDALSPQSAARLLARAVRRDWTVLAATREGPVGQSGDIPSSRDWCTHVVCQGGVLRPVAAR